MPKYAIEIVSETYGSELFTYPTDQARLAGLQALLRGALHAKDGVARTYYFALLHGETDFTDTEIAAEFDGKTVTFTEYGIPPWASNQSAESAAANPSGTGQP